MATARPAQPTEIASRDRRFRVRGRHEDIHHGRVLHEPTFHAAAIAYVEHLSFLESDQAGISVIVQDVETGHEHSFWVHLDGGELLTEP